MEPIKIWDPGESSPLGEERDQLIEASQKKKQVGF